MKVLAAQDTLTRRISEMGVEKVCCGDVGSLKYFSAESMKEWITVIRAARQSKK